MKINKERIFLVILLILTLIYLLSPCRFFDGTSGLNIECIWGNCSMLLGIPFLLFFLTRFWYLFLGLILFIIIEHLLLKKFNFKHKGWWILWSVLLILLVIVKIFNQKRFFDMG
jgi:hypothetical protein